MINVIGMGYIGLPTALMMVKSGYKVVGTDYNKELIEKLSEGNISFSEKDLDELLKEALKSGIKFSTEYQKTDMYIVSVPTPYETLSKKTDTGFVVDAIEKIIDVCEKGTIIVIESTVSPGTIEKVIRPVIEKRGLVIGRDINLVHAPERIMPGNMVNELIYNNRTIGADDVLIGEKIKEYYASFCKGEIVVTDIKTAEMTKVVENTYRAVNIAFANELAKICSYDKMDVYEVIKICNMHPRVNILNPGPGVGGHCISVDPWFLVGDYPKLSNVICEAMKVNESMPGFVLEKIYEIMKEKGITDTLRVGLYGLTYKEDVDDCRNSPTLQLIECQKKCSEKAFKVYDPYVKTAIVDNQYDNLDEFLDDIDVVVIMVSHNEIKENADKLKNKIIFDTKNALGLKDAYRI